MADVPVGGPVATDLFSIGGNWIAQSSPNNDMAQRASGLGATGDETASKLYDNKNEVSVEYENQTTGSAFTFPSVGTVSGGYHIDSVSVAFTAEGWPRMTVSGHAHDSNMHADADMNKYAFPSVITAGIVQGFGVPSGFASGTAGVSIRKSVTMNLSATHIDELDGDGEHGAGENHNGQCTVECTYMGAPTTPSILSTFDLVSSNNQPNNAALTTKTLSFVKAVTRT